VNLLVAAHRADAGDHEIAAIELTRLVAGDEPIGLPDASLSGFIRISTSPKIWSRPSTPEQAFEFVSELLGQDHVVTLTSGPRQWAIFEGLCRHVTARGNLVTDAWLAAMAIEHDCEWLSFDHDFARFPGLRWRDPRQG
jgi:hypothetical protein